jgi:hypothetical protein
MAAFGTQDWTQKQLSPHKDRLWRVVERGGARLRRLPADDQLAFNARCTADVLNSFIIAEAESVFDGVKGSEFLPINNTTYHLLNGCVLWYKQLNSEDLPSNIPTPTVEEMMQGRFEFMPNQLLLVVGFKLDALKHSLVRIDLMRFGAGQRAEFLIELTKVTAPPSVLKMPPYEKTAPRRRTKIEIRAGFEQKRLRVESE